MIVIIKKYHSDEPYNDEGTFTYKVLRVRTNKIASVIEIEWKKFVYTKLLEQSVIVNENWIEVLLEISPIKGSKGKKIVKNFLKDHSFENWLKENYAVKEEIFGEILI